MNKFTRLVRFIAHDNEVYYGNASTTGTPSSANIITGDIFGAYKIASSQTPIKKLLCPIDTATIRTVRGIGLNYLTHAKETNLPIPKYPILFHKPVTAVCGPDDDIKIPKFIQGENNASDYECELVIVIGRTAKDVSKENALEYVLGYTVGNDVSQRVWQMEKGGSQWCFSKGFDNSAPIGPQIVTPDLLHDASGLRISTTLNGDRVQDSSTSDLIFNVRELIAFLSQGTTLLPGDVIFTGTPHGVGMSRSPQRYLRHGDEVVVSIDAIGSCRNIVSWGTSKSKL